jgi:hypothetical protein
MRIMRLCAWAPEIVSAMQRLAVEQRRVLAVRAPWHVGDIAWGVRQHEGRENEWRIRLWVEGGSAVAWSWLKQDGSGLLDHDVHPQHCHLLDEILSEPAAKVAAAFEDDAERREALALNGFTQPGDSLHFLVRDLARPPEPPHLPAGFTYRAVGAADVPERVSIHREVWAPSRVTESSDAQVRAQWPVPAGVGVVRVDRFSTPRHARRVRPPGSALGTRAHPSGPPTARQATTSPA